MVWLFTVFLHRPHILQRQRPAQILVVHINRVRVGERSRRKEWTLRGGDVVAWFLLPVRQVIHSVQTVQIAKITHTVQTAIDGCHLR